MTAVFLWVHRRTRVTYRNPAAEAAAKQRRREWTAARRAAVRAEQTTPMHPAVWVGFGVLCAAALVTANLAAIPGLALIGCGIWWYARRRAERVAANLERQRRARGTGFEAMAATYEQVGLPESARAYRDLADDDRRTG